MGTRTISLTGRPPVKIDEEEWPVIAEGGRLHDDNGQDLPRGIKLLVREGPGDRWLVYGVLRSLYKDEQTQRAGRLVTAAGDLVEAIYEVAELVGGDRWLAEEAIQDLPAETL